MLIAVEYKLCTAAIHVNELENSERTDFRMLVHRNPNKLTIVQGGCTCALGHRNATLDLLACSSPLPFFSLFLSFLSFRKTSLGDYRFVYCPSHSLTSHHWHMSSPVQSYRTIRPDSPPFTSCRLFHELSASTCVYGRAVSPGRTHDNIRAVLVTRAV